MAIFGKFFVIIFVVAFVACTTAEVLSELTIRKERVCNGSVLSITCPSKKTIFVTHALFGRVLGSDVCPHSQISDQNCRAPNSLSVVQGECNGEFSCTVTATSSVFGDDPCYGTFKYLEVTYLCA